MEAGWCRAGDGTGELAEEIHGCGVNERLLLGSVVDEAWGRGRVGDATPWREESGASIEC